MAAITTASFLFAVGRCGSPALVGYLAGKALTHPADIRDLLTVGTLASSDPLSRCTALELPHLASIADEMPLADVRYQFQRAKALCAARADRGAVADLASIAKQQALLHQQPVRRFVVASLLQDARALSVAAPDQSRFITKYAHDLLHNTSGNELPALAKDHS